MRILLANSLLYTAYFVLFKRPVGVIVVINAAWSELPMGLSFVTWPLISSDVKIRSRVASFLEVYFWILERLCFLRYGSAISSCYLWSPLKSPAMIVCECWNLLRTVSIMFQTDSITELFLESYGGMYTPITITAGSEEIIIGKTCSFFIYICCAK